MESQRLLVVSNQLSKDDALVLADAIAMIEKTQAISRIDLLHIQPLVAAHCFALPSTIQFLDDCQQRAEISLNFWGEILDVPTRYQWTTHGNIRQEIQLFIEKFHIGCLLTSKQLTKQLEPKWPVFHKESFPLIRSFGPLNLYNTQTAHHKAHWAHPIPQAI
jgi:ABC-type transporter Mla MlaB component